MATIRAYTTIEQSRKLAEILPLESADMHWEDDMVVELGHGWHPHHIPCWSLAALIGVLPSPSLHKTYSGWRCGSFNEKDVAIRIGDSVDNAVDACVDMILKLHELKLL